MPRLLATTALLLALATAPAHAAGGGRLSAALDNARYDLGAPAATAAVYRSGHLVWAGAAGYTTASGDRYTRPGTKFVLASDTKTYTATMILQLVQAGKLSLDEPLSDFYPQLPNARAITIRELLNHTSGLANYEDNNAISDLMDNYPAHRWTRAEVIAAIGRPQFAPGAKFVYTNSNYIVLGGILEKVSGASVESNFQRHIAGPAHMRRSSFLYRPRQAGQFARPYWEDNAGKLHTYWVAGLGISSDTWGPVWTDGGLGSTSTDMARFMDSLFAGRLISPSLLRTMTSTGKHDYGFGIYAKSFGGRRWLGHDGTYGGFESEQWHSGNVTITVLTDLEESDNADDTTSDQVWNAVARAYYRGS